MNKSKIRVLIADDEKNIREVLRTEFAADGFLVAEAENGDQAFERLQRDEFDVLILDLNMPGLSGIEVLGRMRSLDLPAEVIVLTANATISTAVEAMKLGAYEYLMKPFDLDVLVNIVERAYEKRTLRCENLRLRTHMKRQVSGMEVIAVSPAMMECLETVNKVAQTDFTVLINGESGVGKELIARAIHHESAWSDGPFVPINCGAIPETMIESELFGYEKGAFTGAHARKLGLLELANNGTLFLDEIGDMPLQLQVKMLRFLETERFFRLGGTREQHVHVRVLSATNKDLKTGVDKGSFRQDLFYRISGFVILVPPLRERREDIPLFIKHYTMKTTAFKRKRFDQEALQLLSEYPWPGNVRELQHVVQRALLLSKGEIVRPSELPADLLHERYFVSERLDDIERDHIIKVLKKTGGQKEKAAVILGIHPKTLRRKMVEYGVAD